MLKDSEDCFFIKRRKLSLSQTTIDTTPTTTTPPITPLTSPPPAALNMMMIPASAGIAASLNTSASSPTAHHTLIPSTMAATLLANVAAANSSTTCHSTVAATPLALTQAVAPPPPPPSSTATPATTSAQTAVQAAAQAAVAAMTSTITAHSGGIGSCAAATATAFPDHYSLRWNNHQNHMLHAFDALLQTKNLVDVTLVCAETSIQAHKMVLSACSPFFQRVFEETPCKHPVIVLKDFQGWVVQAIVDFMYRGEISVPQERLQTLIQSGESLQVRGLVESSVPEHTPTPAASPDDFGMLDTSLMSSELGRCSSFDEESPSMVTAGSKVILPSRLFGASMRRERELERKRDRVRERDLERDIEESDQELQHDSSGVHSDVCTSPMPRRKQARPRRRSGELPHELASRPASPILPSQQSPQESVPMAMPLDCSDNLHTTNNTTLNTIEALKTVIKTELAEPMDEDDDDAEGGGARRAGQDEEDDSGKGNDSHEQNESFEKSVYHPGETEPADLSSLAKESTEHERTETEHHRHQSLNNEVTDDLCDNNENDMEDENDHDNDNIEDIQEDEQEPEEEEEEEEEEPEEDIEELINTSNELRRHRKSLSGHYSEGPEDLCTTKKDNDTPSGGLHSSSLSDSERCSPAAAANNNNNNSKLNNNNHRVVLALKDIRHLHKPSTPTSSSAAGGAPGNNMHPFAAASLRDLRLDRAANAAAAAAVENHCKMEALEAQMHAAAAAAAVAAANGENPFQHMEQQMDLSLAAACAAVSHQQSRERDHQAMRDQQRELQHHHNAYANSLLGPMGMGPGMPGLGHFGPERGNGPNGPSAHERLEDSMNRLSKEFGPSSPMSLPGHFNPSDGGPPHAPSPLPFSGMCSALALTPPHMFGMDSTLGIFPPGIDPGKLYNPLMEMSDPRGLGGDHPPPFLKKKMPRPKGQHSAPRGGPPRSWTNTELTDALQHVWNKKMTTSQASRVFGIPYNSLLMYVRGKYGKSLKLEQLRRDCISGPPLELLQMGISGGSSKKNKGGGGGESNKNQKDHHNINELNSINAEMLEMGIPLPGGPGSGGGGGPRSTSSEPDLLGGPNSLFNPFPPGFYPDFPGAFPGLPLSMLNLLPPAERHQHAAAAAAMHQHMSSMDEDCKSDRSKHSSLDEEFMSGIGGGGGRPGASTTPSLSAATMQPLALNREHEQRRNSSGGGGELGSVGCNAASGAPSSTSTATATSTSAAAQQNGHVQD